MDPRWSSIDPLLSIEIGCLFGKAKNQKLEMKPKNIALTQRKNSFVIIVSSKTNERAKTEINLSDITNYRLFSGEGLATPLLRMNAWNGEYTIKFDVDRDRANWMAHLKVAIGMVQKNFEWLSYFLFVIYPSSSGHKDPALLRLLPEDEPVEIVIENPITHDDIQRFYMRQLLEFDYSNGNIVVLTFTNNTAVTSHECVKSKFDFRCFWARSLVAVLTKRLTALGLPFKSAKVGGEFRRSFSKDEAPLSPQRKTVDFQSNRFPSPRDDATSPRDSSAESERYRRRSDGQWPANTANSSAVPEATGAVLANSGAADYPDSKLQQVPEHFPPAPPPPTNVPEEAIDGGEEYLTDASALPPPPAFLSEPPPLSSPSPSPSAPVTEIYPDATRVTEIYPDATRVTEIYPDATRITEVYPKATHRTRTQSISPSPLDASAKGDGAKAKCLTLPNRKIRRISRDVPTDKPSDDEYAPLSPAKNTRPVDLEAFRRSFRIVPQYSTDSDVGVAPALPVSPMTPTHVPRNTPTSTALGAMSRQDSGLYVNMEAFSQFHLHEDIEPMYPPTRSPPKPSKPPRRQTSLTENTETDALDQAACGTVNARQDQQAYSTSEEHRKAFRAGSARPKPAPRPHSLRGLDWTKASHPSERKRSVEDDPTYDDLNLQSKEPTAGVHIHPVAERYERAVMSAHSPQDEAMGLFESFESDPEFPEDENGSQAGDNAVHYHHRNASPIFTPLRSTRSGEEDEEGDGSLEMLSNGGPGAPWIRRNVFQRRVTEGTVDAPEAAGFLNNDHPHALEERDDYDKEAAS